MRPLSLLLLLAAPAVAADVPDHRTLGDKALAAREVLNTHCASCHGAKDTRGGRLVVSDHTTLVNHAKPVPFVDLDPKSPSQVAEFLKDGSMPPGGRLRPTAAEVQAVEEWVAAGAPPFPATFDDAAVLALAADDLGRVAEKDWPTTRYVSLLHLAREPAKLRAAEAALAAALARDGKKVFGDILKPLAASANTVYRLNLTAAGWGDGGKHLFERQDGFDDDWVPVRVVPFDLIQLEYPYTHAPATTADAKKRAGDALKQMNAHRKDEGKEPLAQLRAVGFVRGDWLANSLRQEGTPTALAEELAALGKLAAALPAAGEEKPGEKAVRAGEGPKVKPFAGGAKAADATAPSVWAWYQGDVAPADAPFKFTAASTLKNPVVRDADFILTADSDTKGVGVSCVEVFPDKTRVMGLVAKYGKEPLAANTPTALAEYSGGKVVMPGLPAGGRVFILVFAAAKPGHGPVVVRSRHQERPVWRVIPHPADAGTDAVPAVRRRIDIQVSE